MEGTTRSTIIKSVTPRGFHIPHMLLEQAGLTGEVAIIIEGGRVIIQSVRSPRQGWDAQFAAMAEQGDDALLDSITPTQWEDDGWAW